VLAQTTLVVSCLDLLPQPAFVVSCLDLLPEAAFVVSCLGLLAQPALVVSGLDVIALPAVVVHDDGLGRHAYRGALREGGVADESHAGWESDQQGRSCCDEDALHVRFLSSILVSQPFSFALSPLSSLTGSPRH
jgi:hypothetical protein